MYDALALTGSSSYFRGGRPPPAKCAPGGIREGRCDPHLRQTGARLLRFHRQETATTASRWGGLRTASGEPGGRDVRPGGRRRCKLRWMEVQNRCACGEAATANGRECPSCFRNRLLSIRLDTSVTSTRSLRNYFDSQPLDETFGEDRVDRYWEETDGQGALKRGPDGNLWHKPIHADEPRIATPEVIDSFLGPETDDPT